MPYFNVTVVTITHTRRSGGVLSRLSDSSCLLNSRFEFELKVWVQQESAVWWYKSVLQCGNSVGISVHTEVAFGQSIVWLYIILQHCALLPLQCNNIYATEWHASTLHSIICCAVFAKITSLGLHPSFLWHTIIAELWYWQINSHMFTAPFSIAVLQLMQCANTLTKLDTETTIKWTLMTALTIREGRAGLMFWQVKYFLHSAISTVHAMPCISQ